MDNDRDVTSYKISPNATTVLYSADAQTAGLRGLYAVPIGGGIGLQLVQTPVAGGSIYQYDWTADSDKVVYMGQIEALGAAHVYSINANGSGKQTIDDGIPGTLVSFEMVSNSHIIVYTLIGGVTFEIYSVRIDGAGGAVKLNKTLPSGGNVVQAEATADGQWVVYRADATTDEDFQLFSVKIDGTSHQLLSGININGGDVQDFTLAPDSKHVVWTGDLLLDQRVDLFSWTVDKTGLIGFLDSAGANVERPLVSPDSQWVAYVTDDINNGDQMRFTPIDSSESEASSLYFANKTNVFSFAFSPDSRNLVFIYDQGTAGKRNLSSDAILANTPSHSLAGNADILDFETTPDSRYVISRSKDKNSLMISPIESVVSFIMTDLDAGRSVEQFAITPQGDYVVYRADRNAAGTLELFAVPLSYQPNMADETVKLNSIFNTTNDVTSFLLSAQGDVVYRADSAAVDGKFELYARGNQHQVYLPLLVK
jgi:dipeptidyl aminopeptidase/acylaminoacyl peptidase